MARRVLGAFAVTATAALTMVALATPASAHDKFLSAECVKDKAVLSVKLTQYAGGNKNKLLIKDGEKVLVDEKFDKNWGEKVDNKLESKKFVADGTVEHKFFVKVTASDDSKYSFEETLKTPKCVETPPTTTTKPATTTTTPVATSPEVPSSSEAPPSTTPAAPGGSAPEPPLAATGASPAWLLLSGLGLVGAGAGTLLFLRRRRSA
ncbi:LPXTG cell wall anchor domain-containing protein [Lentzea sp. NEAU-D7]|uniref:LPXTG cell wall anchor domain-containing protein n=1 Tax=Lentzea sp. NEAU-D7 TaxID=2994667 RepID=UPI00224AF4E7|nr:LPXTG cell wall anchor domain-containing protein [Lentzea sp. NEAU-D7]MCX2947537.1 LPXTG cell wall anchor domain-containing protein [Lentzea sp. NEAU-D7]